MNKKVGEKIRQARSFLKYSQDNVADAIDMSPGNYGKIERGEIEVGSNNLIKIAEFLKVSVGDFFDDKVKFNSKETGSNYGYINQDEFSEFRHSVEKSIDKLTKAIEKIQEQLPVKKASKKKSAKK